VLAKRRAFAYAALDEFDKSRQDCETKYMTYETARAAALKILGDKAKVPERPDNLKKANTNLVKALDEFSKTQDACEAKLLAMENANDGALNALKQFLAKIEKNDFNLDSKDKDDAKKIQQARDLLTAPIDDAIKDRKLNDKALDELDKHLIQLGKYKPSASD
jgi:hypothetical protein